MKMYHITCSAVGSKSALWASTETVAEANLLADCCSLVELTLDEGGGATGLNLDATAATVVVSGMSPPHQVITGKL